MVDLIDLVEKEHRNKQVPVFGVGDTIRVWTKIVEGENERLQPFQGVVIRRKGRSVSETFTVRKVSYGVGVERIFPLYSPSIDRIELLKSGKVRRAKLYYLRHLSGKAARIEAGEDKKQVEGEKTPIESTTTEQQKV